MRYFAMMLCGLSLLVMAVYAEEAAAADEAPEAKPAPLGKTTVPYGVLFESSWNKATGISKEAATDGGRWQSCHGNRKNGVIEVKKDGVAGNNYMHCRVVIFPKQGKEGKWASNWGGVWGPVKGMVESEHTYFRYYQRIYPQPKYTWSGGAKTKSVQNGYTTYGGAQLAGGKHWRSYMMTGRNRDDPLYKKNHYEFFASRMDLDLNRWYRYEGHIRWLEHEKASRTVWDMRIYDEKGELVKTTKDWFPIYRGEYNLEEYFKKGRFIYAEGLDPCWRPGFTGPTMGKVPEDAKKGDSAPAYDFCAFEVRNDRWCGRVKGGATPDAEAPKLTLVKPSARAALTVKTETVTLEGTASDNTELYEVHWLSSNGLTGKAKGLANWKAEVPLSPGENVITLIATDKYLNSAEAKLTITRGR